MIDASTAVALVVCGAFIAMAMNWLRPPMAIWGGLHLLLIGGWIPAETALSGFASPALHTIAVLLAISSGVRQSGALTAVGRLFLGRSHDEGRVRWRMMSRVALTSAFLNNTPVVALLLPNVRAWCDAHRVSPSKMLIPLSYAAILGGSCTLIGTSTNLVVLSLLPAPLAQGFGMFTLTPVALPAALVGLGCTALFARHLLPSRGTGESLFGDPRGFLSEVVIERGGVFDGATLAELRTEDGAQLQPAEILREERSIVAPHGEFRLRGGDRLRLAGPASQMVQMHHFTGLEPASQEPGQRPSVARGLIAVEAVISSGSSLTGRTVGEGSFRRRYGGAVLAVARRGQTIAPQGVSGWRLQPGDILLIEAEPAFLDRYRRSDDLIVLSEAPAPNQGKAWHGPAALATVTAMVGIAAFEALSTFQAASAALLVMFALGIVNWQGALKSLDIPTLLTIAAALGLAASVHHTGLDAELGAMMAELCDSPSIGVLVLLFLCTVLCTELVTNSAAAALMIPVALALAERHGLATPMPYIVTVAIAACASFVTPMGYQTNLLVYGPGRYRFADFLRAGLPVSCCVGAVTIAMVPLLWPF